MQFTYKFVISERFKMGLWFAISEDDKNIDPVLMHDKLNELGQQGWDLVAVIPIGESAMNHDQLLKHVLKRKME